MLNMALALALTPELTFLIGLIAFWVILYLIATVLHLGKHGLDVKPGYFMYRSDKLNSSIDRIAKKKPFLWTILANIGVALSFGLMAFSLYFLINNLVQFSQVGQISYVAPVVPGLTLSLIWLPFFFFAAAVVILPHEFAHGIVSRLEDIPVLSTGVFAFLVFFGAFVEPDEKAFEKTSLIGRLRMLSVGSATNLVTAILTTLLLLGLFAPPTGILIHETIPNGPVAQVGLGQWDVVQAINGTKITSYTAFYSYMANVTPGEKLTLTALHNNHVENVTITTQSAPDNSSRPIIGVQSSWASYQPNRLGLDQYTGVNLYWTLFWIYLIALSVAIFNMLPLYPFDGERVLYYPLERLVKKRKRELRIALSGFTLGLFALNTIISLWRYGLFSI